MRLSRASGPPLKPSASTISSLSTSSTLKPCSLTTSRPSTILIAFIRLWATSLLSNSKTASSLNQSMLFNQLPVHISEATSEGRSAGVLEYRARFELHPPRRVGDAEGPTDSGSTRNPAAPFSITLSALIVFYCEVPRSRRVSPAAARLTSLQRFAPNGLLPCSVHRAAARLVRSLNSYLSVLYVAIFPVYTLMSSQTALLPHCQPPSPSASQLVLRSHTLDLGTPSMSASQPRRALRVTRLAKEEARRAPRLPLKKKSTALEISIKNLRPKRMWL